MPNALRSPLLVVLALCCLLSLPTDATALKSFTQDFSSVAGRNTAETSAIWDTVSGTLTPPPYVSTLVGSLDLTGSVRGVEVDGDVAWIAAGSAGVHAVDISDPTAPVLLDTYDTPGYVYQVAVEGQFVFVADWESGVHVLDAFDPSNLLLASTYDTAGAVLDVAPDGDLLFLCDGAGGLIALDVSDPFLPALLSVFVTPGPGARDIKIAGDTVYLADGSGGLVAVNVSDPANPALLGQYTPAGNTRGVAVSGNTAYLADAVVGFVAVDITDPANPAVLSTLPIAGEMRRIDVHGDFVYIANATTGFHVIDVRDPSNPVQREVFDTNGAVYDVDVDGELAYVADFGPGLKVVEIAQARPLDEASSIATPDEARTVRVEGNFAYVGDLSGLWVFDIRNPAQPVHVGGYTAVGFVDMWVAGDLLYAGTTQTEVLILDISDPTSPQFAGRLDLVLKVTHLEVHGDVLYYTDSLGRLNSVDVSNPSNPSALHTLNFPGNITADVAVAGDWAFVAQYENGVRVVSVADPSFMIHADTLTPADRARGLHIDGDYLYVACDELIQTFDISNPVVSVAGGAFPFTGEDVRAIDVHGNFAYVASDSAVTRVDVSDPMAPTGSGVSFLDPGHTYRAIEVDGHYAYVARTMTADDAAAGLLVLAVSQRDVENSFTTYFAQSHAFDGEANEIVRARVLGQAFDGLEYELSTYYTGPFPFWPDMSPLGNWRALSPGSNLAFRIRMSWRPEALPVVDAFTAEWMNDFGRIDGLVDAPADQGGWVRMTLGRSGYDFVDDQRAPVTGYQVYRRVDDPVAKRPPAGVTEEEGLQRWTDGDRTFVQATSHATFPAGTWEAVSWVAATQSDQYVVALPTVADSTASGNHLSHFVVTTHTTTPTEWFCSPVESVASIDNVAPGVPQNLAAAYSADEVMLSWDAPLEEDFQYHRIYRDLTPGFHPGANTLVGQTADPNWTDDLASPWSYHYKVSTVDRAGNESEAATVAQATAAPVTDAGLRFALAGAVPNPFNPSTAIAYSIADPGPVRLTVYDLGGREVARLVDGPQDAGSHTVRWLGTDASGRRVASGVYLYRLEQAGRAVTKRMVLVK